MNQVKKHNRTQIINKNYDVIIYCLCKPQHYNNINGILLREFRQDNCVESLKGKIWSIIISPIGSTAPESSVGEAVIPRRLGSKGLRVKLVMGWRRSQCRAGHQRIARKLLPVTDTMWEAESNFRWFCGHGTDSGKIYGLSDDLDIWRGRLLNTTTGSAFIS